MHQTRLALCAAHCTRPPSQNLHASEQACSMRSSLHQDARPPNICTHQNRLAAQTAPRTRTRAHTLHLSGLEHSALKARAHVQDPVLVCFCAPGCPSKQMHLLSGCAWSTCSFSEALIPLLACMHQDELPHVAPIWLRLEHAAPPIIDSQGSSSMLLLFEVHSLFALFEVYSVLRFLWCAHSWTAVCSNVCSTPSAINYPCIQVPASIKTKLFQALSFFTFYDATHKHNVWECPIGCACSITV